jgi:hypothetical protein
MTILGSPKHHRRTLGVAGLVLTALVAFAPAAGAAKSSAPKPTGGSGSSLSLVLLDSTDGLAHYGQHITWNVSTTATTQPFVSVQCSHAGTVVYSTYTGYFADFAWPWTQTMTLSSNAWTGGAADCSARLYSSSSTGKTTTLATTTFHGYA